MLGIVIPAQRYGKSSRGTPRLRRLPWDLHGAPSLALLTKPMSSSLFFGGSQMPRLSDLG
jgi:hypothetical protein